MDKEFDWPGGNYTYKANQNSINFKHQFSNLLNDD